MREILFRGKRVSDGEWAYGSLLKVTIDYKSAYMIFGDDFIFAGDGVRALNHAMVDPATVGQYTGLTDKNGKRIFEGDILGMRIEDRQYIEGDVKYGVFNRTCRHSGVYGWYVKYQKLSGDIRHVEDGLLEIFGNIHDNPELLEVK